MRGVVHLQQHIILRDGIVIHGSDAGVDLVIFYGDDTCHDRAPLVGFVVGHYRNVASSIIDCLRHHIKEVDAFRCCQSRFKESLTVCRYYR